MISGNGRARRDEIEDTIKRTKVSKEACEKAQGEFNNLHSISAISAAEQTTVVVRNYFDWLPSVA